MKASNEIKELIKGWEGCRLTAYVCPAGALTIGYGHTGSDVIPGKKITQEQADELFERDIDKFAASVAPMVEGVALRQSQFDAIVSLAYNIGGGAFYRSTLLRKLKANPDDPSIPAEFRRWSKSGGKVLPGLVKRREREAAVYAKGEYR